MDIAASSIGAQVPDLAQQPPSRQRRALSNLRLVLALGFFAAAIGSLVSLAQLCVLEAHLAGGVVSAVTRGTTFVVPQQPDIYFGLGTEDVFGLRISNGCSGALLALPILIFAAVLLLGRRGHVPDILIGLSIAIGFIILFNQTRIAVIAWSSARWGMQGFGWSHTIGGSVISLVGLAIALIAFFGTSIGLHRKALRRLRNRKSRPDERVA